mmetsp:Transcript_23058/g.65352  ORF Transcript_23058/g.65352 Transcript_23058/m.65352 type:complete len:251 (-) Transcript_23058:1414-2166(-)
MSPLYSVMHLLSQIMIFSAHCEISRMSWLIISTPPLNCRKHLANASIDSMSNGFVGSSSSSRWGFSCAIMANTMRAFWPAESWDITCVCCPPVHPYRPSSGRIRSNDSSGITFSLKKSSGVMSKSSRSSKCCENLDVRRCMLRFTAPFVGYRSPSISFTRVVFPAPFGPTNATRVCKSIPKSTLLYSSGPPGYPKLKLSMAHTGTGNSPASGKVQSHSGSCSGSCVSPASSFFCSSFSRACACRTIFTVP